MTAQQAQQPLPPQQQGHSPFDAGPWAPSLPAASHHHHHHQYQHQAHRGSFEGGQQHRHAAYGGHHVPPPYAGGGNPMYGAEYNPMMMRYQPQQHHGGGGYGYAPHHHHHGQHQHQHHHNRRSDRHGGGRGGGNFSHGSQQHHQHAVANSGVEFGAGYGAQHTQEQQSGGAGHHYAAQEPPQSQDERGADFCKALAKVAKPRPPWSIGAEPTNDIDVEIQRLESFFAPTSRDTQETRDVWDAIKNALTEIEPVPQLQYTGCNSWSFFPFRGRLFVAAPGVPDAAASQLSAKLFRHGCRLVREFTDERHTTAFLIEHSETHREVVLRVGKSGARAAETARQIQSSAMPAEVRSTLNCIIMLLRQSKIIDDLEPSALSDESAAIMALAIAHSYQERPQSTRLLIDFFLTYGFKAHFDTENLAVDIAGMVESVPKTHKNDAIEIRDPGDRSLNLAVGVTTKKLQFMQSTLNYCYHVVSEFAKESDPQKQRGQSPLSTILGGEPFWPRVVDLANLNVQPYVTFLHENRARAHDEAAKQRVRKAMQGRR